MSLSGRVLVDVPNRSVPNSGFLVSGRADWALGYSSKDEDGALPVVMEGQKRSEFSTRESQLIAYLAILRGNRRRAGKTNPFTQSFYSDGTHFAFVGIEDDGTVVQSPTCDTGAAGEIALRSTPTVTPTKPGVLQDKEIHYFDDEVWSRVYKLAHGSLMVVDDGNMDIVIDMSSFRPGASRPE
ncbi:MAG: hypothetical protein Q9217_001552 [Psora testacea]